MTGDLFDAVTQLLPYSGEFVLAVIVFAILVVAVVTMGLWEAACAIAGVIRHIRGNR